MNIACIEHLGISLERFEQLCLEFGPQGHILLHYADRCEDPDEVVKRMQGAEVVVVSNIRLTAEMLQQCPKLRYISVAFTGLDHIDLDYCAAHNITVQNAAGYSTTAVSELSIALMLDLLRKITYSDSIIRNGQGRGEMLGSELRGKTVGIIGTGAIGLATMRLLQAFGCRLLAYSRHEREEAIALGARYTPLDELLQQSDIVSLHVPLTTETRHLIGARELSLMKPSALLINTARGPVMDIDAVALALNEGRLAGVATDVYEKEPPLEASHPLLNAPRCICLPHIGYATYESFEARIDIVFDHVRQWLAAQK